MRTISEAVHLKGMELFDAGLDIMISSPAHIGNYWWVRISINGETVVLDSPPLGSAPPDWITLRAALAFLQGLSWIGTETVVDIINRQDGKED